MLVAGLMVSTVPYRGFRSFRISRETVLVIALTLAAVLVTAVRWNLSTAFMAFGVSYIASGPAELVLRRLILRQEWGHATLRARSDGASASVDDHEDDTFEL